MLKPVQRASGIVVLHERELQARTSSLQPAVCNQQRCGTTHAVHPCTLHTHPPCTYQRRDVDGRRGRRPRSMLTLHAIRQDEGSSWSSVSHRAADRRQSSVRDSRVTDSAERDEPSRTELKTLVCKQCNGNPQTSALSTSGDGIPDRIVTIGSF